MRETLAPSQSYYHILQLRYRLSILRAKVCCYLSFDRLLISLSAAERVGEFIPHLNNPVVSPPNLLREVAHAQISLIHSLREVPGLIPV